MCPVTSRLGALLLAQVLLVASSLAQSSTADPAADAGDGPLRAIPYTPSLDVAAMDRTADPCVDFYQYSCGVWRAHNPIPPDQARWSVYGKLYEENQRFLWGILETLADSTTDRSASQ